MHTLRPRSLVLFYISTSYKEYMDFLDIQYTYIYYLLLSKKIYIPASKAYFHDPYVRQKEMLINSWPTP